MSIVRDKTEHISITLVPDSMVTSNLPWLVPSVNTRDGNLRIRSFDKRDNAMAYIDSFDEDARPWFEDFDREFASWQMGNVNFSKPS